MHPCSEGRSLMARTSQTISDNSCGPQEVERLGGGSISRRFILRQSVVL